VKAVDAFVVSLARGAGRRLGKKIIDALWRSAQRHVKSKK